MPLDWMCTFGRMGDGPTLTLLERTKIQAEVLVPLVRAMDDEVGRDRAHRLVRDTLGGQVGESIRAATSPGGAPDTVELLRSSQQGDALDLNRVNGTADDVNVNVTRCEYADFSNQLDEPELGFRSVCSLDYDVADGAGVTLERSQTIMQGSDHCDLRFKGVNP